ncbi:hypothetical protein BC829DRAFT_458831 [Chytridium lagenaria]|nr:hypothetical protein BC829DRAFT_458831 [Chytridium lagenaria]
MVTSSSLLRGRDVYAKWRLINFVFKILTDERGGRDKGWHQGRGPVKWIRALFIDADGEGRAGKSGCGSSQVMGDAFGATSVEGREAYEQEVEVQTDVVDTGGGILHTMDSGTRRLEARSLTSNGGTEGLPGEGRGGGWEEGEPPCQSDEEEPEPTMESMLREAEEEVVQGRYSNHGGWRREHHQKVLAAFINEGSEGGELLVTAFQALSKVKHGIDVKSVAAWLLFTRVGASGAVTGGRGVVKTGMVVITRGRRRRYPRTDCHQGERTETTFTTLENSAIAISTY